MPVFTQTDGAPAVPMGLPEEKAVRAIGLPEGVEADLRKPHWYWYCV